MQREFKWIMNQKTNEKRAFITVLAIFSMGQIAGSIDAAIAWMHGRRTPVSYAL